MANILITGAAGQLGIATRKEYENTGNVLFLTEMSAGDDYDALDISDLEAVNEYVMSHGIDIIINCAAYTNVDGCELHEDTAYQANALGPKNLAIVADKTGAKLIHISTDYVFEGISEAPLVESDSVNPVSAYGRTKLAGEEFVKENCRRYFIIRTAWLYGEGKNFVKTMINLSKDHDLLTVVNDQFGSPTSAIELAKVIRLLAASEKYGVYHGTCEGSTCWADFTREIFRQLGINTEVVGVTSEEYKQMNPASANRPKYSILDGKALRDNFNGYKMADWKVALEAYLNNYIKDLGGM